MTLRCHCFIGRSIWWMTTPFYPSLNQMAFDDNLVLWKSFWEEIYSRWVHIWGGVTTNSLEREGFLHWMKIMDLTRCPQALHWWSANLNHVAIFPTGIQAKSHSHRSPHEKELGECRRMWEMHHGLLALSSLAHWDNGEMRKLVKQMGWNA